MECGRKLSVVGLPVFFEPGSSEQLTFGLLICFLSNIIEQRVMQSLGLTTLGFSAGITIFAYNRPCKDPKDDTLAIFCLLEVFIALLATIVLYLPREPNLRSLVPRAQPADQEMMSSHLAAGATISPFPRLRWVTFLPYTHRKNLRGTVSLRES